MYHSGAMGDIWVREVGGFFMWESMSVSQKAFPYSHCCSSYGGDIIAVWILTGCCLLL